MLERPGLENIRVRSEGIEGSSPDLGDTVRGTGLVRFGGKDNKSIILHLERLPKRPGP